MGEDLTNMEKGDFEFAAELVIKDFIAKTAEQENVPESQVVENLLRGHHYGRE